MTFSPGDMVTCVSTTHTCETCGDVITSEPGLLHAPRIGQTYRVLAVGPGDCVRCDAPTPSFEPAGEGLPADRCWPQSCFVREEPGTDIFSLAERTPVHA